MAAEADVCPGSHNEWTQHAVVQGWAAVEEQLESLAHAQCQGASMKVVSVRDHAKSVVYKYGCGFFYSHKCKWCCRVATTDVYWYTNHVSSSASIHGQF